MNIQVHGSEDEKPLPSPSLTWPPGLFASDVLLARSDLGLRHGLSSDPTDRSMQLPAYLLEDRSHVHCNYSCHKSRVDPKCSTGLSLTQN